MRGSAVGHPPQADIPEHGHRGVVVLVLVKLGLGDEDVLDLQISENRMNHDPELVVELCL